MIQISQISESTLQRGLVPLHWGWEGWEASSDCERVEYSA